MLLAFTTYLGVLLIQSARPLCWTPSFYRLLSSCHPLDAVVRCGALRDDDAPSSTRSGSQMLNAIYCLLSVMSMTASFVILADMEQPFAGCVIS